MFDDDGWRLKSDPAEHPDPAEAGRLADLRRWLDARSRSIRLADLLIEVENDLWRLVEENQRAALAGIVHGHLPPRRRRPLGRRHDVGQRFALPHKVLQRTYAPFYSRPVECTDRDAPFVLDGVLYHESDDTHGYTEINFAASATYSRRRPARRCSRGDL